jgi:hypothetical protein
MIPWTVSMSHRRRRLDVIRKFRASPAQISPRLSLVMLVKDMPLSIEEA